MSTSGGRTLSILMPVYNEAQTVERAIEEVLATELPVERELIIVDDGSSDGTREILERGDWPANVSILHHDSNRGKGAAVRTAVAHASGDWSAIIDADLEYDPGDLSAMVDPLLHEETRVVFGVRAFNGYSSFSFLYVLGNRAVTLAANMLFNVYIGDLMTCHKAIDTELFKSLPLRANGFAIEPEITASLLNRGERIYEVPVRYQARSRDAGKKLTAADGVRVIATLLRCRFSPGRHHAATGR